MVVELFGDIPTWAVYELSDMDIKPKDRQRFFTKVRKSKDGCWGFDGADGGDGYRIFTIGGRLLRAHRVSFELFKREIPIGMCVLHRCDNPGCVNPDHLFIGTQADNVADKCKKGRQAMGDSSGPRKHPDRRPWGDRNGSRRHPELLTRGVDVITAKLTDVKVREIRRRFTDGGISKAGLAREFMVTDVQIGRIVMMRCWRHVK